MKNYNEIADSVFSRRDKALEEKYNRRKTAKNIILPVVCLCAVIGAVIGMGDTMIPGIVIGVAGMAMAIVNYPIYKGILNSRKKKYADIIIALSNELMAE